MGCNYLSISKLQRLHRWSLEMDKKFHPTLNTGCDYLSMLGLKLNYVSKRGHNMCLYSELVYPTWLFQALWLFILAVFGAVHEPTTCPRVSRHIFNCLLWISWSVTSIEWKIVLHYYDRNYWYRSSRVFSSFHPCFHPSNRFSVDYYHFI